MFRFFKRKKFTRLKIEKPAKVEVSVVNKEIARVRSFFNESEFQTLYMTALEEQLKRRKQHLFEAVVDLQIDSDEDFMRYLKEEFDMFIKTRQLYDSIKGEL